MRRRTSAEFGRSEGGRVGEVRSHTDAVALTETAEEFV